jgi:hypothetical protein
VSFPLPPIRNTGAYFVLLEKVSFPALPQVATYGERIENESFPEVPIVFESETELKNVAIRINPLRKE